MFQNALIESGPALSPRLRASAGVALVLHAAAALLVIGGSLWSPGDAPEPAIPIVFSVPFLPPPLGDRGPAGRVEKPGAAASSAAARSARPADRVIALAREPGLIEPERRPATRVDAADSNPEATSGVDGDGSGGGTGGDPEGVGSGVPGGMPDPRAEAPREILRPGGDVRAPVMILRIDPDYPEAARRAHIEGTAVLEAVISATGTVEEVRLVHSANPLLDAAAVRAVEAWRYRPATQNGRAVRVLLTVTVIFGMH